ncbi:MAG: PorT family protein [Bacteroidaceae bacterium]|nr:PorT family protein [Bacteroidaceae bacterium]MBR6925708.1 PorT family protein [Bacteroidaceae bacterium]MBR7029571.1 PorT family protein [Bacteroidaceae bacterium]
MNIAICLLAALFCLCAPTAKAQNRKIQHKPYIDQRVLHYGFFVGVHDQGISLRGNGYIDPATGRQWMVKNDRPNFGFHVGVLGELKLHQYVALRALPTLYFGSKHLAYVDQLTGEHQSQDMKSTYIGLPILAKISAPRWNNYRPYIVAGINPMYDLTTGKHTLLRAKPLSVNLEIGLGCDFYLPFFKLIPELKFSLGLADILDHKREDLHEAEDIIYTRSVDRATSNMVTLTLYFE